MEDISLLGGGVFGDLDDIFGILYGDYTIWDDYLVFELIYFVFLLVHLVCWATYLIFGYTPVCILDAVFCFFYDFLVFWMVHFWGPTVRGPICHFFRSDSWAPDNWAPGPNCPGPNLPGPNCPGPNCPGPNLPRTVYKII